ncbi:hypothetical protein PF005_g6940 [Phytophthora fragariae]|uniref:Myb/SANT-like domain-containing protein n=1 Tax=Phytophthora fragariae TaxID=53985 RepID=A0A6A3UF32_9STRA|nr:hypothetical protein PF003_g16592 [Phytophthora fragariae]KAE8942525.1 hypothetical protein PF009_g7722 [Phytophthora fragariae]KAE9004618.1 hypothetical protein PF011_g12374 [Phytophthora fragariae]KAE9123129.1 hypothetical protein PF007_g7168 [Phytophthora fragariae]KAE9123854.1 hypothetical protein PF010_g6222 [Phytophthora fragariae]
MSESSQASPRDACSDQQLDDSASKVHLTVDDYRIIVTWMENKANFEAVHGSSDKPPVGGKPKISKDEAFKRLAVYVAQKTKNAKLRRDLTGGKMRQRWRTYMQRFKRTLKARNSETGLGLTMRELAKGVSIPEKLEGMCPHFARMEGLFTHKPNVNPSAILELGIPPALSGAVVDGSDVATNDYESTDSVDWPSSGTLTCIDAAQTEMLPSAELLSATSGSATARDDTAQSFHERSVCDPAAEPTPAESTFAQASPTNRSAASRPASLEPSHPPADLRQPSSASKKASTDPSKTSSGERNVKRQKTSNTDILKSISSTTNKNNKKGEPTTAHEARVSLSAAYARNAEAKVTYLKQKLDEERRQWNLKHVDETLRRETEAEERKAHRRHELVLELLRQGKPVSEIEEFVRMFG